MPMSPASVANAFHTKSGKIKLALLDEDFQDILDFLNTTLSYSNYVTDTGGVNTLAVAFSGGLTFTMTEGQIIFVKAANTNTGPSTIAVNGSFADAIVKAGGAALIAGDVLAGYIYCFVRRASNWQLITAVPGAPIGSNFADDETPAGAINGTNAVFTLATAPSPAASLQLFLNGLLQRPGGVDYTLVTLTITFTSGAKPQTGDNLRAWYRY